MSKASMVLNFEEVYSLYINYAHKKGLGTRSGDDEKLNSTHQHMQEVAIGYLHQKTLTQDCPSKQIVNRRLIILLFAMMCISPFLVHYEHINVFSLQKFHFHMLRGLNLMTKQA